MKSIGKMHVKKNYMIIKYRSRMNSINFYIIVFLSIACFSSCKTNSKIAMPAESYTTDNYKPILSVVGMPVSIEQKTMLAKINKQMDGLLYEDSNFDDDNLTMKVWKAQPITLNITGNTIDYRVPLRIWLNTGISKFGIKLQKDLEIQLALKYKTVFSINPDWSIQSTTNADGFEWLSDPYISILGIQIPVKSLVNKIIDDKQSSFSADIDKLVQQYIDIKKPAQQAWKDFQKPILLNKDYNIWLKLQPKSVFMAPFKNENGIISTTIGIEALSEILISKQSPPIPPPTTLPPFKMLPMAENGFNISMGIDVPYTEVEEIALANMAGKPFKDGKREVKIDSLNIYGSNGKVVVAALLEGSFKGKVYLTGIPVYNSKSQTIEITELDFSLATKSILLKSVGWLFHSGIAKKIAESAKFPISTYLNDAKANTNKSFHSNTSLKNIILNGEVSRIDIDKILLSPTSFKVIGIAEGKLALSLKNLDF
jgi:hypothetical protein